MNELGIYLYVSLCGLCVIQAFAGAEEDEDDMLDFYTQDKMSNYDAVLGDEPEQPHSFTKPSGKTNFL